MPISSASEGIQWACLPPNRSRAMRPLELASTCLLRQSHNYGANIGGIGFQTVPSHSGPVYSVAIVGTRGVGGNPLVSLHHSCRPAHTLP
ncbi:unnamed protein product [Parajaminaea phylloscopi]